MLWANIHGPLYHGRWQPLVAIKLSKKWEALFFLIGLLFPFIEMKELCEARAKLEISSNCQIYLGKTDDEPTI